MSGQELSETVTEKKLSALGAEQWMSNLISFFLDTRYLDSEKFWKSPHWKFGLWQILENSLLKNIDSDKFWKIPYWKIWTLTNLDLENFSSSDFRLRNFQYLTLDLEIILIVDSGLRNFLKFDFGL